MPAPVPAPWLPLGAPPAGTPGASCPGVEEPPDPDPDPVLAEPPGETGTGSGFGAGPVGPGETPPVLAAGSRGGGGIGRLSPAAATRTSEVTQTGVWSLDFE